MTEITVILPTRHRPALLETTLLSLLTARSEAERQGLCRIRLLVVDDAPDNEDTRALVASMPGVDYARVEVHDGRADPGAAILLGLGLVDTEFHALFGDDDIALPRHFTAAIPLIREGMDVVSSSFHLVDSELRLRDEVILRPTGLHHVLQGKTNLNDGSFVRTELFREIDFDVSLEAHMLVPGWTRLMLDSRAFGIVTEPTWLYRRHDANISHSSFSERDLRLRARARKLVANLVADRLDVVRNLYGVEAAPGPVNS